MSKKTVRLFTVSALLMAGALHASAQTATESVTVMGSREAYHTFSRTFATPTEVSGKMARWERRVCPIVVGQNAHYAAFITQHIKYVALAAGAPVAVEPSCRPNIEIVFTTTPQQLLDNVRKEHVAFLGYASNMAQADRLARVRHPIQAWYTTANMDLNGFEKIDNSRTIGLGDSGEFAASLMMGNVTGLRMRDGRKSTLYHAIIAIDPAKLLDHEIGGVADYISMLALSQMTTLNQCQPLASIINMLVPGCAAAASELTANDLAYLRGLYRMPLDGNLRMQEDGIGREMAAALNTQ